MSAPQVLALLATMNPREQIENLAGVLIPELRAYLDAFPFGPRSFLVNEGRLYTPAQAAERLRELVSGGFFERPWPALWLPLGNDGAGQEYFVDVSLANPPVRRADHETSGHSIVAATFARWLAEALEIDAAPDNWQGQS